MTVQDIMDPVCVTVSEEATYKEVADKLATLKCGCVFVFDQAGALAGLVSERDLLRILFPFYQSYYLNPELYTDSGEREKKIEEVQAHVVSRFMTREIHSAAPEDPIMRAAATMLAKNVRRLPVLQAGKLVGVVTRRQVYKALYEGHLK